jgi:ectoine hydroxylase-related dioxygenase (phytanoyl-CoA dioxygenase family)
MSALLLSQIKSSGDIAVPVGEARQQLQKNGYAVVRGAITPEKVEELKKELYADLARLGTGIKIDDPSTFKNANWPGVASVGIFKDPSPHWAFGEFMFECRQAALPVFQVLWGEEDLITSFDTVGIYRNHNTQELENTKTKGMWLHVDQGSESGKEFKCVQGMVNLFPADASTGGLVVVPGSHLTLEQTLEHAKDKKRALDNSGSFLPPGPTCRTCCSF